MAVDREGRYEIILVEDDGLSKFWEKEDDHLIQEEITTVIPIYRGYQENSNTYL
jgi:hypothetical protein